MDVEMWRWLLRLPHPGKGKVLSPPGSVVAGVPVISAPAPAAELMPELLPLALLDEGRSSAPAPFLPASKLEVEVGDAQASALVRSTNFATPQLPIGIPDPNTVRTGELDDSILATAALADLSKTAAAGLKPETRPSLPAAGMPSQIPKRSNQWIEERARYFSRGGYAPSPTDTLRFFAPDMLFRLDPATRSQSPDRAERTSANKD
jgi:hypothetical protein